jgi:Uri superfamily endonuclease
MVEIIVPSHTLYAIYLDVKCEKIIEIGKLGNYSFKKGIYIYVGSAKRNIIARINRHQKVHKSQKWHFDYLRPHGTIIKIITYENSIGECPLAEKIRKMEGGVFPIKRFGSTDCRCFSHLIYLQN